MKQYILLFIVSIVLFSCTSSTFDPDLPKPNGVYKYIGYSMEQVEHWELEVSGHTLKERTDSTISFDNGEDNIADEHNTMYLRNNVVDMVKVEFTGYNLEDGENLSLISTMVLQKLGFTNKIFKEEHPDGLVYMFRSTKDTSYTCIFGITIWGGTNTTFQLFFVKNTSVNAKLFDMYLEEKRRLIHDV